MRRVGAVLAAVGLLTLGVGVNVWAAADDGSQVKITSPAEGAVVKGGDVEIKYELTKGSKATHVHCFVDGEYQKGWKGMVKGMSPGTREIKLVAADKDHETLAAESAIKVEVQ
ncbi:MAG TPA: hypothetical protein VN647_08635 [Nitrospira sp.]|nr:hypothetical protein [Nitrospira sp.]